MNNEAVCQVKLTSSLLEMDFSETQKRICRFIKEYVENAGAKGIVLGLSGGIDSGTIAALSALPSEAKTFWGLCCPRERILTKKTLMTQKLLRSKFRLETQVCDMSDALGGIYGAIPIFDQADKLCKGNIKARTRMIYLYYYANKQNRIVCGSSDKSETMMGYFTKWGDAAADIAPIMDLYKTQVRKLAIHFGIPKDLALKPSTPALWPNQLAESELGIKYETLDLILYGLERFMAQEEIAAQLAVEKAIVDKVKSDGSQMNTNEECRYPLKLDIDPWETILGFQDTPIKVEPR